MRESIRVLGLYVRGQVLLSLILAVLYSAAFAAAQVPYWYAVGIIGGITAIIPRIGALIPIGLAAIALNFNNAPMRDYLMAIGLWLLIQALEFFVLLPKLIGKPLGLKELPVLAALLLGSLAFGPIGLLLAVPVLAIGLVFWRHFRKPRTS